MEKQPKKKTHKKNINLSKKRTMRPPIVTVMGHVDHGKTTLLDYIRKTSVAAHEHGGITQHIGAYQVEIDTKEGKRKITFVDTPGHEAFAKMRSRGAAITDIVILVVAANDGVMPQTIEAIKHIKDANIPAIVAINKIDLPDTKVEKVKKQLAKNGLLVEGYGGDVVTVEISAKTGKGVPELLEMISLVADMEPVKSDPVGELKVSVIESRLDKKLGPVATVIVLNGTLNVRDTIDLGGVKSRIRALISDAGKKILSAGPGTPVEITGLGKVPEIGESTKSTGGEKETKEVQSSENKLKIILKTDVIGSFEAIKYSIPPEIEILNGGTGDIFESDILFAKTSKAIVIGFNVKLSPQVEALAQTERVNVKLYYIIYELLDEIKEVVELLNNPSALEEIVGRARIVVKFATSAGEVAGSKVTEGKISRGDKIKLIRQDKEVGTAKVKALHHLKKDIPKAEVGTECGILFHPNLDFQIGDMVVSLREKA